MYSVYYSNVQVDTKNKNNNKDNIQVTHNSNKSIAILSKQCGCKYVYIYPMCNKTDKINGGCLESCACNAYTLSHIECSVHYVSR